jgi:hypothetical protein
MGGDACNAELPHRIPIAGGRCSRLNQEAPFASQRSRNCSIVKSKSSKLNSVPQQMQML